MLLFLTFHSQVTPFILLSFGLIIYSQNMRRNNVFTVSLCKTLY
ncbi:hypothetical protein SALWKB29_0341 [Snodgrassella communis]|uniref:Uncharacterized protein n=1 Tax=Snodgrassella communis TaxID=2946699 RepID=A0A836Z3V5_9NEIS|nr:hypothetical protein SALWKB29_0341 [Snodgrassella communis]